MNESDRGPAYKVAIKAAESYDGWSSDACECVDALLNSGVVILAADLKPLADLHSNTAGMCIECGPRDIVEWPCESARLLSALMDRP